MASSASDGERLTTEECLALEDIKLTLKPTVPGKRQVSCAILSPPISSLFSSNSSNTASPAVTISYKNSNAPTNTYLDLPDVAESIEALEWIGYTYETACTIFGNWSKRPTPSISGLIDYAKGWTSQLLLPTFKDLSTAEALIKLGLKERTRIAILAPNIPGMCESQDLRERIDETLYLNWLSLLQILRRLKKAAIVAVAQKSGERSEGELGSEQAESSISNASI